MTTIRAAQTAEDLTDQAALAVIEHGRTCPACLDRIVQDNDCATRTVLVELVEHARRAERGNRGR